MISPFPASTTLQWYILALETLKTMLSESDTDGFGLYEHKTLLVHLFSDAKD